LEHEIAVLQTIPLRCAIPKPLCEKRPILLRMVCNIRRRCATFDYEFDGLTLPVISGKERRHTDTCEKFCETP
jgi:hypothetical protein